MKPSAILINASRGTVVEIDTPLAQALREGHLLGAAVDVFPVEPKSNKDEFDTSPLRGLDNVILTPHHRRLRAGGAGQHRPGGGGKTGQVQRQRHQHYLGQLPRWRCPRTRASTASCTCTTTSRACSRPSTRCSRRCVNIAGQYLQTDDKLGYVVIDLDAQSSELALEKLSQVAGHPAAACCSRRLPYAPAAYLTCTSLAQGQMAAAPGA